MRKKVKNCVEIVQRDENVISKASRAPYFPLVMKSGRGAIVEDMDGNKYIDMFSSAAVLNTGHCHPKIIQAINEQIDKFIHFSTDYMYSEPQVQFAEMLTKITPGDFKKKVCFGLSGSDGNDGAIKLARSYTGRTKVISFIGAYHGSTYGAISLSAISLNMRRKIGPLLPEIYHMPYPDCYRCSFGKKREYCLMECLEYMKTAFQNYIPSEEVAAIIIEPIAGDIGFAIPPQKYMEELYRMCKEKGILFIVDEVQQGFGRTGKWFSIEHFGIVPDVIIMGKSIASGLPLSAIVAREEIVDALNMPAHLFTVQGNPVCAKSAIATIEVINEENLIEHSNVLGEYIKERFNFMKEKYELIGDVRGKGLSIGVELVKDRITKEKDTQAAIKICYRCWQKGVILIFLAENILRVQPPLVITREEVKAALNIIEETIQEYIDGKISDQALEIVKGW
ncbi:aspartate aminotransferase family protein [Anaeromicrobium sediminis]|uniref:(S)-3-amino-2-methylpropionate transaminase n=1 Tax=Anaeromicrobium sediminis TaxID=1478221 RepID=A0A267M9M4_9FIRM|nr:aspartate aminotransferase family protein [Anaeromicrobium sediminis]PAB55545.1 aspartate aminotransferase family protein [Anaeromicrobium sediminis]